MKFLFVLLLISTNTFSQNYTLFQYENEYYRDYSFEELSERLGEDAALLPFYRCNGENEYDLFTPAPRLNPFRNSLKIKGPEGDQFIYQKGFLYLENGERYSKKVQGFLEDALQALKKIESIPEGAKLLRGLENSYFPLIIVKGGNNFIPKEENGISYRGIYMSNAISIFDQGRATSQVVDFKSIGVGGLISWNPQSKNIPPQVVLGHEMMHALDSIRGLLDMRFVKGEKYESAFVSEYRAIYFENLLRKAAGFPYRTHYGSLTAGLGMLDEKGEPRYMPSPCIK